MKDQKMKISDEMVRVLDGMVITQGLLDGIVAMLNIDQSDDIYRNAIVADLEEQIRRKLQVSIWKNMSGGEGNKFKQFVTERRAKLPQISLNYLLVEFALAHEGLKDKIFAELSEFLQSYIKTFNTFASS